MIGIHNWKIWKPELSGKLELISYSHDEFLNIFIISDDKYKIEIVYKLSLTSQRVIPATYRSQTVSKFKKHFNIDSGGLFISKSSDYKDWIKQENKHWPYECPPYSVDNFVHHMYITENYVVDVICHFEPEISITEI